MWKLRPEEPLSRRCLLLAVLSFGASCQRDLPEPLGSASSQDAKLEWTMTRVDGDKALRIEYRVTNVSEKRIYLSDLIHRGQNGHRTLPDPQPIAVMNDAEPRVVRFLRGRVPTFASPTVPYFDPGARAIAPGQTVSGYAQVPLPLKAASYSGPVGPLNWWPKAAVLQLGYFRNEPTGTIVQLAEGGTILISEKTQTNRMEWLRSDIKPIPTRPFWKIF